MRSRGATSVTLSVWFALFVREGLQRVLTDRFGWFWVMAQPVAQIALLVLIRDLIGRIKFIVGVDFIPWLVSGVMVFTLFSEATIRAIGAIDANRGLFVYRQVKPIDTVLVRILLEGVIKTLVFLLLIFGLGYFDVSYLPNDPYLVLGAWMLAWFLGFGVGVFMSAVTQLVSELNSVVKIIMFPLYFLSGVMLPVSILGDEVFQLLVLNPVLHVVELTRFTWFEYYQLHHEISLIYPLLFSLTFLFLGLLLHLRYEDRFKAI